MPFGLKNARATYQRLVDKVFHDQIGRNLEAYVDDMVIKSTSEEDMLADSKETFERFRSINMKLNPKKCSFGVEEGSFLGHLITKQGIRANPSKLKAITDVEQQKTLKDIQGLNGKLAALNCFLTRGAERVLQGAEINYPTLEKLILALVHAARRLRRYFQAHTVTVLTDLPIKQTLTKPKQSGRVSKLAIELGEHDIVFRKKGDDNKEMPKDFLIEVPFEDNIKETRGKTNTKSEKIRLSCEWKLCTDGAASFNGSGIRLMLIDPEGKENQNKKSDALSKLASMTFEHLTKEVRIKVLAKRSIEEKEIPQVETKEEESWMTPIHEYLEQFAIRKAAENDAIAAGNGWPFSHWGVNILGPFPTAPGGLKLFAIAIEHSTKWVEAKPLTTISGRHAERFVWEHVVCRFGAMNNQLERRKAFPRRHIRRSLQRIESHAILLPCYRAHGNNEPYRKNTPKKYPKGDIVQPNLRLRGHNPNSRNVAKDDKGRTKEVTKKKEGKEVASIEEAYYQNKLRRYHNERSSHSTYKIEDFVLLSQNDTGNPQVWQGPHMISEVRKGEIYKIIVASDHSLI
ncbi:reverse transcriptase domain-containing protein [Tanacetum coccineum]